MIDIEFQTDVIKRKCYYRGDYKRMKVLLGRINCLRLRLKNFSRPSFCPKRQLQKASS